MAVPMSSATARVTTSGGTKYSSRLPTLPGFKVTSCLTVVLLICLETVLLCTVSNCAKSFYVHWNTTNSIFRIDNTDHIIDVNKGNLKFEYDQVNIICPVYTSGHEEDAEKYIIYNVSKEEYETCRITNPNPRIIAICDKPYKLMYFTITFRPFTPQPGGLEFLPGNDYYFISTSSRDDLHRRIGGRCTSHNMKVVFKVCCSPEQSTSHLPNTSLAPGRGPVYFSSTSATSLSWPIWPITSTSNHPPPTTIQIATTQKTLRPYIKTTKKNNEYDKHANEVVKNEELTYKSGVPLWRLHFHSAAGLWLLLCTLLPLIITRWR